MTNDKDIYVTNIEQAVTVTIRNYVDPNTLLNDNRKFKITVILINLKMQSTLVVNWHYKTFTLNEMSRSVHKIIVDNHIVFI